MKKTILFFNSIIVSILTLFSLIGLSYTIFKINIVPLKYLLICYSIILIIVGLLIYLIFSKKNIGIKIGANFILLFLTLIFITISIYLNKTYYFFKETNKDYDTLTYSVIVLKDKYNNLDELKSIMYLNDDYKEDVKNVLISKLNYEEILFDNMSDATNALLKEEVSAIVLEDSYYILAKEKDNEFADKTKVIYNFEIKVKTYNSDSTSDNIMEPFILYISGIDQYGEIKSVRGRSDVNQLVVVNPKTNKILLVNTPRDYYVQLVGTTGLKDKLTHAGVYGIEKSIGTLENLYDIHINYYLRVNFNTVVNLVDVIGGIDIDSDMEFDSSGGVHFVKGLNHLDGKKALAYSRERHAYITGDHHRGANQQQVITAILEKTTKSSILISKYSSILNTLNGSFQTDMPMAEITSFIKYQLDKMPKWDIKSIAVTGYNSSNYTYSMGTNYKLYVMEPDWESVENAQEEIRGVLNGA